MQYYLAPMEGITGHIYRNALKEFFQMPEKCFTPFIAPNQNRCMNAREEREVSPERNQGVCIVPQILTNKSELFVKTCEELKELGYEEVNLNLGCPSGTVVAKKRGSGFLSVPQQLDLFLDEIFTYTNIKISIKTRLGIEQPEEFYNILEMYNKYPLHELIIHPRVQKDFYKNKPHMDMFKEALQMSRHKICYNGDIFTKQDLEEFQQEFPNVDTVMLGRGIVSNPGLLNLIRQENGKTDTIITKEQIKDFHQCLLEGYRGEIHGDINVLYKMKEMWFYMSRIFEDSEKIIKKIRKIQKLGEYEKFTDRLLEEKELVFAERLYFSK